MQKRLEINTVPGKFSPPDQEHHRMDVPQGSAPSREQFSIVLVHIAQEVDGRDLAKEFVIQSPFMASGADESPSKGRAAAVMALYVRLPVPSSSANRCIAVAGL